LTPTDEPSTGIATVAGFSLHAGVAAEAHQHDKLERLIRYITRTALSEKRLSLTEHGTIRYQLKTPYRDGTTISSSSRSISSHASPPSCHTPAST
jgi:hypothetical protein